MNLAQAVHQRESCLGQQQLFDLPLDAAFQRQLTRHQLPRRRRRLSEWHRNEKCPQ